MTLNDYDISNFDNFDYEYLVFMVNKNGYNYSGLCDYQGSVILEPVYDNIEIIENTNIVVLKRDKSFVINKNDLKNGNINEKSRIHFVHYDICYDEDDDNRVYLIALIEYKMKFFNNNNNENDYVIFDKDGNKIVYLIDSEVKYCNDGMFLIGSNGNKKLYNADNNTYLNVYIDKNSEKNKYYGGYIRKDPLYFGDYKNNCYIDKYGKTVHPNSEYCTDFHRSIKSGKYTAIVRKNNSQYQEVIDNDFNVLFTVNNGDELIHTEHDVFIIRDKNLYLKGVVDIEGKEIIPIMYNSITLTTNGIIICSGNKKIDYYNLDGIKIDLLNYTDYVFDINNDIACFKTIIDLKEKYFLIDSRGNILCNNTLFDEVSDVFNNRAIVVKKEISYNANNIYEYERYSVIDSEGNVIFSYPEDGKYNDLISLCTSNHEYYIGATKNRDEYVLLDKEGIEIDRFKSEEIPKIYGNYYSYKEEGKYNLCNYLRKSNHRYVFVPLFDEVVSSGSDIKNPNGDYIKIINDRCFEFYLDGGVHRLYIDKDDNLEIFDYNKKNNSLIRRLFKR